MPGNQDMQTPLWLFKLLCNYVFTHSGRKLSIDTAATKQNALCKRFFTKEDNGLIQTWDDDSFNNPPWKNFGAWVHKGYLEAKNNGIVVCHVGPVGCSQRWFHEDTKKGTVLAPDKRISYFHPETGKQTKNADRDTMIYLFGGPFWNPKKDRFLVKPLNVRGVW